MVKHQIGKVFKQVYYRVQFLHHYFSLYIYIYIYIYIHINDLTNNLNDNVKLFADDTSLFLKICDNLGTANVLDNDLNKIRKWAEQRKMVYNPGPTTKPQEIPKTFRTQTRPKAEF